MTTEVYWIRAKHHSDITSEGYVGVSKNASKRWQYGHNWAYGKGKPSKKYAHITECRWIA